MLGKPIIRPICAAEGKQTNRMAELVCAHECLSVRTLHWVIVLLKEKYKCRWASNSLPTVTSLKHVLSVIVYV